MPTPKSWILISYVVVQNAAKDSQQIQLRLIFFVFLWSCVNCLGDVIFTVPEELPNGAVVGNINKDLGFASGKLTNREFNIDFGDNKQYLFINSENGNMLINERIDREIICGTTTPCRINVRLLMKQPFQLLSAVMDILDINDNAPTFPVNNLHFDIMESVPVGTVLPIQSASDQDVGSNGINIYKLSPNGHFSLDIYNSSDGDLVVKLVVDKILDREQKSAHHLLLTAVDGGEPQRSGTVEIVIKVLDANDNFPVFDKPVYKASLLEDAPVGTLVIQVKAKDLDEGMNGVIVYSFDSHTQRKLRDTFNINSSSGEIRLKNIMGMGETKSYELHVQASDKGTPTLSGYCKVILDIIDVNNNAPEIAITLVSSHIQEDAEVGTVVALITVTDRDSGINALVICQITDNIPFKLKPVARYYTLVTDGLLDRETISAYNITVTATDSGSPPLTAESDIVVIIDDVNDNPPRFSQESYKVYVKENNSVGDFLCQIIALDPDQGLNGRVTYSVLDRELNGFPVTNCVSISTENGNVYARTVFDYEKQRNFEVLIEARDQGYPPLSSTATVQVSIVDQNDNPPMFLYPPTTEGFVPVEMVPRSAEVGFLVTKVITVDADSGQNAWLSYQLLQASDTSLVYVDGQTGEIRTSRNIKVSDPNKQRVVVEVKDNGVPKRSASVTIGLWLYDTFPQVLPDFDDAVANDNQISNLNMYLIITLVSISLLFIGFFIFLASMLCYKNESSNNCLCSPICRELEFDNCRLKVSIPPSSNITGDLLDIAGAGTETFSQSYQYKAFTGFISEDSSVPQVNCKTGYNGNITPEGYCILVANTEGNVTKGNPAEDKESKPSGFKKCAKCNQKMSIMDGRTICVYCVGAVHLEESCTIWHSFSSRVLLERKNKLIIRGLLKSPFTEVLEEGQGTFKLTNSPSPKSYKSVKRSSPSSGHLEPAEKLTKVTSSDPKIVGPKKSLLAPSASEPIEFEVWSRSPELVLVSPTLRSPLLQLLTSPAPSSRSSRSLSDDDVDRVVCRLLKTPVLAKLLSAPTQRDLELTMTSPLTFIPPLS
ncbi:protocadherin beta-15-like [Protopterus annectens]|uniref:protocadherin beta-15-like n=1 Tax=Protopterus annectens TaxID=7888 RepID=UPI001CF98B6F|nr:protocadherin beta-15-like [Protopterus annectens]